MDLTGEQLIAAPRQRVWEALNDPQILALCIPGCEEVVRLSDTAFEAKVLMKIGPLRARFSGRVEMSDIHAPASCTLLFEGGAGSVGMAHGQSRVTLDEEPEGTRLSYAAEAAIGGKLGQIGGRLIDASAKKMAGDFFSALERQLNPQAATTPEPAKASAPAVTRPAAVPGAVFAAGWSGELQRFFWLALGLVLGALAARGLPF